MKELKEEIDFVRLLKQAAETLIEHEKELYEVHKDEEVELVVSFTFRKDGNITMFVDTVEV